MPHHFRLTRLQDAILGRNDAVLASSLAHLLSEHVGAQRATDSAAAGPRHATWCLRRELLFDSALTVSVPPLPTEPGTTAGFLEDVRVELEAFRRRWPALRPLVVPVKVTFLVIPPSQGKDLDNIALTLLPIIHEVLKPHIAQPHLAPPPQARAGHNA